MTGEELLSAARAFGLVAVGGLALLGVLSLVRPGMWRRLLPVPRLRPGRWTGLDAAGVVLLTQVVPLLLSAPIAALLVASDTLGVGADAKAAGWHALFLASPASVVLFFALTLLALRVRTGTRLAHVGLRTARLPANLALGVLGFLALTAPVLGVYHLLTLLIPVAKYPFEELIARDFPAWEWAFVAFQTVVAAPLLEETAFRGVLQGWLRRATLPGHVILIALTLLFGVAEAEIGRRAFAGALVLGYLGGLIWLRARFMPADANLTYWNYQQGPPRHGGSAAWDADVGAAEEAASEHLDAETPARLPTAEESRQWQRWQWANAHLAVYGSAMIWALMHPLWPTPVPLFLLGLGLGWLALRAQSIIPTITTHALFNAVALLMLYGSASAGDGQNGSEATVAQRPAALGSISSSVPTVPLPRRR